MCFVLLWGYLLLLWTIKLLRKGHSRGDTSQYPWLLGLRVDRVTCTCAPYCLDFFRHLNQRWHVFVLAFMPWFLLKTEETEFPWKLRHRLCARRQVPSTCSWEMSKVHNCVWEWGAQNVYLLVYMQFQHSCASVSRSLSISLPAWNKASVSHNTSGKLK